MNIPSYIELNYENKPVLTQEFEDWANSVGCEYRYDAEFDERKFEWNISLEFNNDDGVLLFKLYWA